MASSSSSSLKNDELRVTEIDSFKSKAEQKGSSVSMIKQGVFAAISSMACVGKTIHPIRMAKIVINILLLISCCEPVAVMARSLNQMSSPPPPPALLAKDARGPVPPFGPSECTMIPGRKGRKCEKNGG